MKIYLPEIVMLTLLFIVACMIVLSIQAHEKRGATMTIEGEEKAYIYKGEEIKRCSEVNLNEVTSGFCWDY